MTSYGMQVLAGPVITSIASKEKGSMGNRMDCAGAQIKNNVSTAVQGALVTGAAAGTYAGVTRMPKTLTGFGNKVNSLIETIARKNDMYVTKWIKNPPARRNGRFVATGYRKVKEFAPSVQKLLKLPAKAKLAWAVTLAALPVLSFIGAKGIYKMGQIDQKYTDKAQLQKQI